MGTVKAVLDTTQYVKVNSVNPGSFIIQSHRDTVRIVFSDVKPARSNTAFHELGGALKESIINTGNIETDVWILAMTDSSSVTITDQVIIPVEETTDGSRGVSVYVQDQFSPVVILPMVNVVGATTITADTMIDDRIIGVDSIVDMTIGDHIRIINMNADRYYFGVITDIIGSTIEVDTPFDFVYMSGSEVTFSSKNMNVDGSVTPVVFELRTGSPSIPSKIDITRMIFVCTTASAIDLNKFGDIVGGLRNGIVFRSTDGEIRNIFNVKTNHDLSGLMYDFTVYEASNPAQGIDGFTARLTFSGQNKIGVVLRVDEGDNLQLIVQDDLSSLDNFEIILEGHIVQD